MSKPESIKDKSLPHGNAGMIQSWLFWAAVREATARIRDLSKLDENPVVRVVVNFGHWETGIRNSPYLKECHAHAHLWLSAECVLGKSITALERHHYPPEDYLLRNALELEQTRILPAMDTRITQDIAELKAHMRLIMEALPPGPPRPRTLLALRGLSWKEARSSGARSKQTEVGK